MAQQLHKFTMNTSLRNAMIFDDDDSWEVDLTPVKKEPFSDDSNSNETSTRYSPKTVIKRELFDDESHSPLKRAFNSIRIKQEDTPIKIKEERVSPLRTDSDSRSSPPHRILRSFDERIANEEKSLFTRREQKGVFTKRAEERKRQTLRSYKTRMRNEQKNSNSEGFKMHPGSVHIKFGTSHIKQEVESSPKKQEATASAPYAFRSYSEKLKQNIDNSKGDSATQTWIRSTKANKTRQQNSANKSTETTNQRKQDGRKHALKRDLSRSSRDECVRKKRHVELENDEKVLQRRQKQIDFGKNTVAYDNYIKLIARNKRAQDDPATPNKYMKYSRRAWDGLIKQWRLRLHKYDP